MRKKELQEKRFSSNSFRRFLILNSPHPHGTESLDISPDGMYILTISKLPEEK